MTQTRRKRKLNYLFLVSPSATATLRRSKRQVFDVFPFVNSRRYRVTRFAGAFLSVGAVVHAGPEQVQLLPATTEQVVMVTSNSWSSATGSLQRYEKEGKTWNEVGPPTSVSLGRTGMAWGKGPNDTGNKASQKREGDRRAPAGIFQLGPAFGYAPQPPAGCTLPYRAITDRDYFVDDPASPDYNRWVAIPRAEPNEPEKRWKSFERMKRPDHLYELGIVIQYNDNPVVPGKGSAVFMHIWRETGAPTAGCTAMMRENLLELLRWLKPAKHPVLVQAPVDELRNVAPAK